MIVRIYGLFAINISKGSMAPEEQGCKGF